MKLSDAVQLTPPKILLFGPPGTWKTTFSTSWGSQTEIIDIDKKLLSAIKVQDKWTPERHAVFVTPCYDKNVQVPTAFEDLKRRVFTISDLCASGKYDKKVLVVDSLTSKGEHAMRKILYGAGVRMIAPVLPPITIPQWGMAINEVENVLTVLKSLPICVIVVAHELTEVVDDVVRTKIWALGAKLPNKLPVGFDEIWYSKIVGAGNDRHAVLQTNATTVTACSRGQLPDGWDTRQGLQETLKKIGYE